MKKLLLLGVLLTMALTAGKVYATSTHTQWNNPEWSSCKSTGSQCGTDNGTQSRTLTCEKGGDSKECSLGTWVETTYKYADPICPSNYHLQNAGQWNQRCHRNYNWMQPEHKSPTGCPSGYSQSGVDCRKVDVEGHYINPETKVEERSCQTGEIDYSACDPEGQCPTECGLESSEVADGKGGYMKCEATPSCEVDQCENLEGMQTEVPEGYISIDGICAKQEEPKKDEPKENTFHKDTRCLDSTPPTPSWAFRYPADGGILANWSAEGGSEVDIEVSNGAGEWEYKYYGMSNDGHEVLPNVAMSQLYRIRTVNGCKSSDWFYDPITSRLPFIR